MYRAPLAIAPPGSNQRAMPVFRSRGPLASKALAPSAAPLTARLFDPVQIGWLDRTMRDDLDPDNADPLATATDSLTVQDITLRPWYPGDATQLCALLDDRAVWEHLPEAYPEPLCEKKAGQMIAAANLADHHQVRAVLLDGKPIGQVRLDYGLHPAPKAPVPERPEAELSYWLGRAHWGKGLGRTIVAGTVARAFVNAPGLLRLVAKVRPKNAPSRRILERAGFERIAPPASRGFGDWHWFGLRRQHWAHASARSL